ncbi:MAG: hypothetical protein L6V85_09095 [Clostridiales bacterium]|nr:MAG: hypothetical protein L6V85_09095 [Clostridiales bacterium]
MIKFILNPAKQRRLPSPLTNARSRFYNVLVHDWTVESGEFEILVGASSRDIKLSHVVTVNAPAVQIKDYSKEAPSYYDIASATELPIEEFSAVYGAEVPENIPPKRGEFDINSTVDEVSITGFGKFLKKVLVFGAKILTKGAANQIMAVNSIVTMPLRSFFRDSRAGLFRNRALTDLSIFFNKKKRRLPQIPERLQKNPKKPQR